MELSVTKPTAIHIWGCSGWRVSQTIIALGSAQTQTLSARIEFSAKHTSVEHSMLRCTCQLAMLVLSNYKYSNNKSQPQILQKLEPYSTTVASPVSVFHYKILQKAYIFDTRNKTRVEGFKHHPQRSFVSTVASTTSEATSSALLPKPLQSISPGLCSLGVWLAVFRLSTLDGADEGMGLAHPERCGRKAKLAQIVSERSRKEQNLNRLHGDLSRTGCFGFAVQITVIPN